MFVCMYVLFVCVHVYTGPQPLCTHKSLSSVCMCMYACTREADLFIANNVFIMHTYIDIYIHTYAQPFVERSVMSLI
jgi:hypothetical protein